MPGFNIGGSQPNQPRNTVEFHRAHRWIISSLGIPTAVGGTSTTEKLRLYAQSIQLPSLSFEEKKIKGGNSYYKIAKRADWQDVVVKFYDVHGLFDLFNKWQDAIWTPEEGIKVPSGYKGDPKFRLLAGDGGKVQEYRLKGAYPKLINHGEMSYTSSEVKILTVTFSYDFAEVEFFSPQPSRGGNGNTRSVGGARRVGGLIPR